MAFLACRDDTPNLHPKCKCKCWSDCVFAPCHMHQLLWGIPPQLIVSLLLTYLSTMQVPHIPTRRMALLQG